MIFYSLNIKNDMKIVVKIFNILKVYIIKAKKTISELDEK